MGHLHTQNPSRNQMPYFSASFRPVVFQATGKIQITRTPIQEGQVLEPGNLHFNKQTRKFWCRCSGDHAWRNSRFRLSTLFKIWGCGSDELSSFLQPHDSNIPSLLIWCPLVLLTLVALVACHCHLSFNLSNKFHALSLSLACLSGNKEPNRIILTFDR